MRSLVPAPSWTSDGGVDRSSNPDESAPNSTELSVWASLNRPTKSCQKPQLAVPDFFQFRDQNVAEAGGRLTINRRPRLKLGITIDDGEWPREGNSRYTLVARQPRIRNAQISGETETFVDRS